MSTSRALCSAVGIFVVIFALAHVLSCHARRVEKASNAGYCCTLTLWTLVATAIVIAVPRVPGAAVTSVLAANVIVAALYYSMVNRGPVTGESFLLHGGCALALLAIAAAGGVELQASPLVAAILTASFMLLNVLAQLWYENKTRAILYPAAMLQHPSWRLIALPMVGAAAAALIARQTQAYAHVL